MRSLHKDKYKINISVPHKDQNSSTVEPLHCRHHGTTAGCQDYRGICISEASGIFPVGAAMDTRAVECYEGAFQSSTLLYAWEKGCPKAGTMQTSAIIMSIC